KSKPSSKRRTVIGRNLASEFKWSIGYLFVTIVQLNGRFQGRSSCNMSRGQQHFSRELESRGVHTSLTEPKKAVQEFVLGSGHDFIVAKNEDIWESGETLGSNENES
ncbi:16255_t:CDS:2, partial [Acaulospora colombiana]